MVAPFGTVEVTPGRRLRAQPLTFQGLEIQDLLLSFQLLEKPVGSALSAEDHLLQDSHGFSLCRTAAEHPGANRTLSVKLKATVVQRPKA